MNWGYLAVFLGSLIEGESVILTASFLASQGYLSIFKVTGVAFIGTLMADQLLFLAGVWGGRRIVKRHEKIEAAAQRAFRLLHKYQTVFILSFRFIYGIRIVSPIVIGMSGIPLKRFAILNLIAAAVWAVVSCSFGYFLGVFVLDYLSLPQKILLMGGIILAISGYALWRLRSKFSEEEHKE